MKYWNVVFAALAIFACGVITGGLVVSHVYRANPPAARAGLAPAPEDGGKRVVEPAAPVEPSRPAPIRQGLEWAAKARVDFLLRASRQLDLSEEQRLEIDRILRERQERVQRISQRIGPDIRTELRLVNEEVRAVLSPEQRRRFERMLHERMRMRVRPGAKN